MMKITHVLTHCICTSVLTRFKRLFLFQQAMTRTEAGTEPAPNPGASARSLSLPGEHPARPSAHHTLPTQLCTHAGFVLLHLVSPTRVRHLCNCCTAFICWIKPKLRPGAQGWGNPTRHHPVVPTPALGKSPRSIPLLPAADTRQARPRRLRHQGRGCASSLCGALSSHGDPVHQAPHFQPVTETRAEAGGCGSSPGSALWAVGTAGLKPRSLQPPPLSQLFNSCATAVRATIPCASESLLSQYLEAFKSLRQFVREATSFGAICSDANSSHSTQRQVHLCSSVTAVSPQESPRSALGLNFSTCQMRKGWQLPPPSSPESSPGPRGLDTKAFISDNTLCDLGFNCHFN